MPDDTENAASSGLKRKLLVLTGSLVTLGAVVGAVNSVITDTKPWACSIGLPVSWCEPPSIADTWSIEVGGPGGDAFDPITCRPGQVLVGLYGKADPAPYIYSIGPICAAVRFDRKHQLAVLSVEAPSKVDDAGSSHGDPFELKCPANMLVIGSELDSAIVNINNSESHSYLVRPLTLKCSGVLSSADASSIKVSSVGERFPFASRKPFSCPDGSAVFGIKGRVGAFIDALSLGCRAYK